MPSPDDALGGVLVETTELGRHVRKCSQTVGVEVLILGRMHTQTHAACYLMFNWNGCPKAKLHMGGAQTYPRPGHVELDGADDHQDEQTAK